MKEVRPMRAAFIHRHGGSDVIEVGTRPVPDVENHEVLVRVHSSGLNHLDVWVRRGWPALKVSFPHVLGADASGVVAKVGRDVEGVRVGDEVIVYPGLSCLRCQFCRSHQESLCSQYRILGEQVDGTNAEYVKVPVDNVFLKPAPLSMVEAASVGLVATTAWHMVVQKGSVKAGDWVLVHAAGSGVGSAAIQIARLKGARVIATAGTEAKLQHAKRLGAECVVNYASSDFTRDVKKIAPQGVDLIIDHVGKDTWSKNLRAVRSGGKIVICGASSGSDAVTDLRHVFFRQIQILGSTMGSKADFPAILSHFARRELMPVVDRTYPLSDIRQAHDQIESRDLFGKIVITI